MPSTYGELELPCLRSTQILTTLVIKLKYIKNLIKRCKKSQNKKNNFLPSTWQNLLARAEVIPSKNIFHAVIAYQKTNISKEIHKPRTLYIDKRTYQSKFLIQIHVNLHHASYT